MTIEERARNLYTNLRKPAYTRIYLEQGFCDGARVEREFVIKEACEALYGLANDHGCDFIDIEAALEYLRKKLKEE